MSLHGAENEGGLIGDLGGTERGFGWLDKECDDDTWFVLLPGDSENV